jgi:hypothetical protein
MEWVKNQQSSQIPQLENLDQAFRSQVQNLYHAPVTEISQRLAASYYTDLIKLPRQHVISKQIYNTLITSKPDVYIQIS